MIASVGGVKASEKTITIKYNSTFTPALPTSSSSVNTQSTEHSVEGLIIKEKGIYKGASTAYLMFAENKGFLYNTVSLGTIKSVAVTYSSGCSTVAKAGVYFGAVEQSDYTNTSNETIAGQSRTDTWTNNTKDLGFFQLSTNNKNCQITEIVIIYDDGGLPLPEINFAKDIVKIELEKTIKNEISSDATNLTYHFSSDNETVATVDEQGLVEGVGIGLATITVSWDAVENTYMEGSANFSVAVYPKGSDIILASDIVKGSAVNSYNDFSDIKILTDAIYAGNAAKSSSGKIQMRSNNNNSGIVCTTSGGVIKHVIVGWGENTSARTLDVYGSNTQYTDASDLYDSGKRGTKLGSITSDPVTTTLDVEDSYEYVGLRSNNGALYLEYIILIWDKANIITPAVNDEEWGKANITGNIITAIPANGYRVSTTNPYEVTPANAATVTQNGNEFTVIATADCTVKVNFEAIPTHTATFSVNDSETEVTIAEGNPITFPADPADIAGKTFVGWTTTALTGNTDDEPTLVTSAIMGTTDVTYYAVYANVTPGTSEEVTDVLTREITGVTGTSYTEWSEKTAKSNAVYAGQSAGGNESIQLRSKDSNSGVITTASGGKLKKVAVEWNSSTSSGRTLNVYGSNVAYTAATDLYGQNAGTQLGTIVYGTSTELEVDGNYDFVGLRSDDGAMYLTSISITWENGTPDTYSGYCTTVVAPVKPAKPIVFHDGGEGVTYEGELTVPMFAEEGATIYYTTDGSEPDVQNAEQAYSSPVSLPVGETTVKAIAVKDGVESDVVTREYRIEAVDAPDINLDGYYSIKNNNGNYVNVAGRKTVTFVDKNTSKTAAGTVIRVKTTNGKVEVLRSQGVDVPRYAERAMSYVPELVKELMKRLSENVENPIIGEDGANLITDEVMDLDYNLYLEEADGGYRIYGKTPSMQRVVDFYATNKTIIDERLPRLEEFVEDVLLKVAERLDHPNSEWASKFKILDIWAKLVVTNPDLTKPEEGNAEAISKFYTEILSSEANIWNFAHETMMIYWTKVDQLINDPESQYASMLGDLGDYKKYLEKVPNILPNFKYYIVSDGSGIDFISEGNEDIINDAARTVWTLEGRENFNVTLPVEKVVNIYPTSSGGTTTTYNEYYGTLYTDFAYQLPADVVAYKIDGIDVVKGKAYIKKTKLENILPAQTPVMLVSNTADIELTLVAGDVAAVSEGELRGNDYLINEYEINSSQAEGIMMILQKLSESLYNEYEHLQRRNAGTVNNKYFFGLAVDPDLGDAYKAKTGNEMENTPVRVLTKKEDGTIAFTESWNTLAGNESFIFNEEYSDILLSRVGDVNRDGQVTIADVTALVNIVLGKVTYPANADKYDFEAANVNGDEQISIADVTALVNIILGK